MSANTSPDQLNQDLSITKDNRYQYFETAIASASEADREIRQAEERGRERRVREQELKQTIKRVMWGVLAAALLAVGGLAVFLMR
ncbi:MAG: hypothetical protein V4772_11780 [Pseudomonadota bacterium]